MKVKIMILQDFLKKFDSQKPQFLKKVNKIKITLIGFTLLNGIFSQIITNYSEQHHTPHIYLTSMVFIDVFYALIVASAIFTKKNIIKKDKQNLKTIFDNSTNKLVFNEEVKKLLLIVDNMILSEEINLNHLETNIFSRLFQPKPRYISREDFELLKKIKHSKYLEENYLLFDALNEKEQKQIILKLKNILPNILKKISSHTEEKYSLMSEIQLKENILELKEDMFFNNLKNDLQTSLEKENKISDFEKNKLHLSHNKNNNIIYSRQDKERIEKEKEKQKKLSL